MNLSPFPHSFSISSFSLHFIFIFSFSFSLNLCNPARSYIPVMQIYDKFWIYNVEVEIIRVMFMHTILVDSLPGKRPQFTVTSRLKLKHALKCKRKCLLRNTAERRNSFRIISRLFFWYFFLQLHPRPNLSGNKSMEIPFSQWNQWGPDLRQSNFFN